MQVVHLQPLYYVPLQKAAKSAAPIRLVSAGQAGQHTPDYTRCRCPTGFISKAWHSAADLVFGLDHDAPEDFGTAACNRYEWVYLAYRILVALYFVAIAFYCGITEFNGSGKWFIYFTNWMFVCLTFSAISQALCVVYHRVAIDEHKKLLRQQAGYKMPILYKITWILSNLVSVPAMLVTIFYWSYVYTNGGPPEGHPLSIGSITKHSIDAVHVAINLLVSNIPRKASHVFQPLLFHSFYFVFTVLFWASGGTDYYGNPYIYEHVDYTKDSRWSIFIMMVFIFATVPMFYILYAIGIMRDHVLKHFGCLKQRKLLRNQSKVLLDIVGRSGRRVVSKKSGGAFLCCAHGVDTVDEGIAQHHFRGRQGRRRSGHSVNATHMGNIITSNHYTCKSSSQATGGKRHGKVTGGSRAYKKAALTRGHPKPQAPSGVAGEMSLIRSASVFSLIYNRWLLRKMYCDCCKQEFRAVNLRLDHNNPDIFGQAQCRRWLGLYIIYRAIWAIFLLIIWIYDLMNEDLKYLIYFTNWSYTMLTFSAVLECMSSIYHSIAVQQIGGKVTGSSYIHGQLPMLYKVTWAFYNTVTTVAPGVTILYWSVLYNQESITVVRIVTHGINSAYVITNLFVAGIPTRLLHIWQPFLFVSAYVLFTGIYYAAGGTNQHGDPYIYSVLDYGGNLGQAVGLCLCLLFVALPIMHSVIFGLYKLRVALYHCRRSCAKMSSVPSSRSIDYTDTVIHV